MCILSPAVSHDGEPGWMLKSAKIKSIVHITHHPGYIGVKTGKEAESMLKKRGGICYLLRYSESHKKFKLSVLSKENNVPFSQHFRIKTTSILDQTEYEIEGTSKRFDTISELLAHYEKNPVNDQISSIGTVYEEEESLTQSLQKQLLQTNENASTGCCKHCEIL